jgi:hypothetical protein
VVHRTLMHRCIIFLLLGASTAGCESLLGDFAVSATPIDGGGASDSGGGGVDASTDAQGTAIVQAVTSDLSVYLGQTAVVDASKSTTTQGSLTFTWTVKTAPSTSHLTTARLMGASSATATFVPDVVGGYVLEVTVHGVGASDAQSSTITAALPQVLYAEGMAGGTGDGGGPAAAFYTMADLDGKNSHPVLCPDVISNATSPDWPAPFAAYGGRAYDFWEAPPGLPSKFAAFTLDYDADAGLSTHLWAGTSHSTCSSPPVDLGSTGFGPRRPYGSEPHFNMDGTRFVIFDRQWHIVTYAADGTGSPRDVATYPVQYSEAESVLDPVGSAGAAGYVFEPPRVAWTASGLAWAQPTATGWEIVTAPDAPTASPTTYMTCSGVTPRGIALLADGTVIASYRPTRQSSENLYQLKPDAQQNCKSEQQYSNLSDAGGSTATDFALSPDGTQIAFLQIDATMHDAAAPWVQGGSQLPGGYVYVVPVAGGTPKQISSEPAIYGPRWIGGGTALVFTRLDGVASSTGVPATSVIAIGPDGGGVHVIARGDGVSTFVSTSGNATCSSGGAVGAGSGGAALWLCAAAGLARRRRR